MYVYSFASQTLARLVYVLALMKYMSLHVHVYTCVHVLAAAMHQSKVVVHVHGSIYIHVCS